MCNSVTSWPCSPDEQPTVSLGTCQRMLKTSAGCSAEWGPRSQPVPIMSHHQHYHGRAMSSEERSSTPINKISTPVHKSASSSSSSQRDSRQVGQRGSGKEIVLSDCSNIKQMWLQRKQEREGWIELQVPADCWETLIVMQTTRQ